MRYVDDYLNHPSMYSSIHSFPIWDEIFSSRGGPQNSLVWCEEGQEEEERKKERKKEREDQQKEGVWSSPD
jgi:hypothetical protein